jgi:Bacterial SH3 domain.
MKNVQKRFLVLAASFTLITTSLFSVAFAHPGRLDKNGGHTNKKTGEYHYHDSNGNEVREKPSKSSSKSKSSTSSKSKSSNYRTVQKTKLYKEADKESKVLCSIPSGAKLTAIEQTEYFAKVKYDGETGYVRLKHCK